VPTRIVTFLWFELWDCRSIAAGYSCHHFCAFKRGLKGEKKEEREKDHTLQRKILSGCLFMN